MSDQGFTLVEVLVVITIIVLLTAIALPVSRSLASKSQAIHCIRNQRQIGLAAMMYAGDNQMTLPVTSHQRTQGGKSWTLTLQPYASGTITFRCPADENKTRLYSYVINDYLTPNPAGAPELDFSRPSKIDRPEATLMFAEASAAYRNTDHFHFSFYHGEGLPAEAFAGQVAVGRHGGNANYLFVDGHVESLSWQDVQARLGRAGSRFVDPSAP